MNAGSIQPSTKREWHGAHHPWAYRPQAFRWISEEIVGINFVPIAREMRAWLMQRGHLRVLSKANQRQSGSYTNPYAYSAAALALIFSRVVNAYHDYATTGTSDHDKVDAELERLRLYNEVLLYAARFCEVAIKQLLYCTQIPEARYERMALGALLDSPCPSCKKRNGKLPHTVSLVGTLAHPFRLCLEFEHCAMDHMDLVNKLRNSEAAHSGIQTLDIRSAKDSRVQLLKDCTEILEGFLHMLSHLEDLEQGMLEDLAEKGAAITLLKRDGLAGEHCNFKLIPGEPFEFDANQ